MGKESLREKRRKQERGIKNARQPWPVWLRGLSAGL